MATKISVFGAAGRMGQEVIKFVKRDLEFALVQEKNEKPDVVIDFSSPEGALEISKWCTNNGVPLVSGTTGLSESQEKEFMEASKSIPLFWSPNLSMGLNAMVLAIKEFSQNFSQGEVTIEEVHHLNKKDNPSGTAKYLYKIVKENVGKKVLINRPIGVREGEVFGIHKVNFLANGEWVRFEHHAENRSIFAQGAVEVAKWLVKQNPGYYEMKNFLQKAIK